MVIVSFTGLDMYLIGELNKKIHSKVAKAYGIKEEDLVFTATDSFVFFKGHEQESFNLIIKVEAPFKYRDLEKDVAELLLEETKDYSIHSRVLFQYYSLDNYYERINSDYPEYIVGDNTVDVDDDEYNEEGEYSEDEIYTGNIFKENGFQDNDERPFNLEDALKKKN